MLRVVLDKHCDHTSIRQWLDYVPTSETRCRKFAGSLQNNKMMNTFCMLRAGSRTGPGTDTGTEIETGTEAGARTRARARAMARAKTETKTKTKARASEDIKLSERTDDVDEACHKCGMFFSLLLAPLPRSTSVHSLPSDLCSLRAHPSELVHCQKHALRRPRSLGHTCS